MFTNVSGVLQSAIKMNFEELDAYSTCMEELQIVQEEFTSCLGSWSCNIQVRIIIAKMALIVHKEKNQGKLNKFYYHVMKVRQLYFFLSNVKFQIFLFLNLH